MNKDFRMAYDVLDKVFREGAYSNILLTEVLDKVDNKALVTKLVYGTLEKNITLEYYISELCENRPQNKINTILKLGLFMQKYMDSIPSYAIVNEMVDLTIYAKKPKLCGFVNATLKNALEKEIALPKDEKMALSVKYSIPLWLVKAYFKQYKREKAIEILSAGSFDFEHIRPNLRKISLEELKNLLDKQGIECNLSDFGGLFVKNSSYIQKLFDEGKITFQSPSSMLVCEACKPEKGMKILDMCSAPGGKAVYLSELVGDDCSVTACDLYSARVEKIKQYASRMGAKNITYKTLDGSVLNETLKGQFDLVLCDAPCSGFGVARKKPDIYLNKTMQDIEALSETQYKLLNNAIEYVKSGGSVVYSTCTTLREENYNVVGKTLKIREDIMLDKMQIPFENDGYIQLLPNGEGLDGFFIARLKKC